MRLVFHDVPVVAFVNCVSTGIVFTGKYLNVKSRLRVIPKHFQKQMAVLNEFCLKNKIVTNADFNLMNFDLYFVDENQNKYKFAGYNSGLKNPVDNGYFLKKI